MSIFGRRRDEGQAAPSSAENAAKPQSANSPSATVPAARDPDLGVPPFRPANRDQTAMNLPPKPSTANAPTAPTPTTPPAGIPPRPSAVVPGQAGHGARPASSAPERRTLVVGKGISLQGTVSDAERLVVEGTVESQMIQAQELHISHAGVFKGEVQVEDAEVAGVFDGTITARGALIVRATGKVLGSARCRRLQVEEGGQISGKMEMIGEGAASAPSRPAVPAEA
jgi:cytoskeletal protein CcmA (bactofilin family)